MTFDISIYDHVQAALGPDDKRALLTVLDAVRQGQRTYTYLEIGSWQGGSLQPIVADPACVEAYSFDARKGGPKYNTLNAGIMRENLRRVPGADIRKLRCWDSPMGVADEILLADVVFIDGWHTPEMAWRDFWACRWMAADVFLFHDIDMIASAFKRAQRALPGSVGYRLSDKVGLIYNGDWGAFATPELRALCRPMRWTRGATWWAIQRRWRRYTPVGLRRLLSPVMTRLRQKVIGL